LIIVHSQADINHEARLSETTVLTCKDDFALCSCSAGQGVDQLIIAHAQADIYHLKRGFHKQLFQIQRRLYFLVL
jgi:hypothetical protein